MLTINTIIKEIESIPIDKLEEVYKFVHSLNTSPSKPVEQNGKSFAGIFNDMPDKVYTEYLEETKRLRNDLFNDRPKSI